MKKNFKTGLLAVASLCLSAAAFGGVNTLVKANAETLPEGAMFEMVEGASLKINSDGGIRFRVKMDKDYRDYIVNNDNVTLNFVIAPDRLFDAVTDGNYAGMSKKIEIEVDESKIYVEDGYYYANACVIGLYEQNRTLAYSSIAYVEVDSAVSAYATTTESVKGGMYDLLTQSVLYTVEDYATPIFECEAYDWFGTEKYPIAIESDAQYQNLVAKLNGGTSYEGKAIQIAAEVNTDSAELNAGVALPETAYTAYTVTFKNDDGSIIETYKVKEGEQIAIPENPVKVADETSVYTFSGWNKEIVTTVYESAEYTATYIATEVTLKGMTTDYFTTNATIKDITYPSYVSGVANQTASSIWFRTHSTYTITFNEDFVTEAKNYDTLTFTVSVWDNGWGVIFTANGTTANLTSNGKTEYTFSTVNWDGKITVTVKNPTWGGGQHDDSTGYNICLIKAVGNICERAINVAEYENVVLVGSAVTAPAYKLVNNFTGEELTDEEVTVSAKFNGETVDITNGFTSQVAGTLVITYSAEDCNDVFATVEFSAKMTLKGMTTDYFTTNATIKDITYPSYVSGVANQTASSIWFRTHSTYTITFSEDFVTEAKNYDTLIFTVSVWDNGWGVIFTANGTTANLTSNGKTEYTFSTVNWDGKITVTVKNPTWGGGQHDDSTGYNICITQAVGAVKGQAIDLADYAKEAIVGSTVTTPAYKIVNNFTGEEVIDGTVTVSATFNGETVDITNGFMSDVVGTLVITYSADDCNDVTATIVFATEVTLKEMTTDYFTTNATVKTVTYPGWDAFSIKNQTVDVIWF
ncbi:MAG: hypothetical protein E7343_05105, partial [Clostridiales bacterium]|nr:hypothetical protein [Clostridiales bacterium]